MWAGPTSPEQAAPGCRGPCLYLKMVGSLLCTGWVLSALTFSAASHLVVLASEGDSAGRGQR